MTHVILKNYFFPFLYLREENVSNFRNKTKKRLFGPKQVKVKEVKTF
jgi:hypothetical protein